MHRSWSGSHVTPIPALRRRRRETTLCRAAGGRHGRLWPQCGIYGPPVPDGAGCSWPRLELAPDRPDRLQQAQTPPTYPQARVDQGRDQHGRVGDRRHFRSASRARRIRDGCTLDSATVLRSRTPCSHVATYGREAIRSNSPRKNSCMDWRLRAARAASSSRTSSGTPLIVICTAMTAY